LLQINFEQRAGSPRIAAWKSFADRANTKAFVFRRHAGPNDRFGTPISKVPGQLFRGAADSTQTKAEEMAAKTTTNSCRAGVFYFSSIGIVTVLPQSSRSCKTLATSWTEDMSRNVYKTEEMSNG